MLKWQLRLSLLTARCVEKEKSTVFSKTNRKHNKTKARYNLKKYTVWCVRNSNDKCTHGTHINRHSGPCTLCVKRLLNLGFKKMGFSDNEGNMRIVKLEHYHDHYITGSQQKMLNNITI